MKNKMLLKELINWINRGEFMTLDEAIEQFKYDAECNRADLDLSYAEDNEQVAEWLEELKFLKQWKSDIMDSFCKYDVSSFEELITNARNKAIDDFVKEYKSCDNRSIQCKKFLNCADCIAEQLKAGVTND